MPGQGRLGDKANVSADAHGCPGCPHPGTGPAIMGSPDVFVNGRPALRVDDMGIHAVCCGPNMWQAQQGAPTVFINGKAAYRMQDPSKHCGGQGQLIEGSSDVIVGDAAGGGGGGGGGAAGGDGGGGGAGSSTGGGGGGSSTGGGGAGSSTGSGGGGAGSSTGGGGATNGLADTDGGGGDPAAGPPVPPTNLPDPHSIEIAIISASGKPVPNVKFELRLPEGTTRGGTTADDGVVRFSNLDVTGTAHLVLPDLDDELGTRSGPKNSGATLYHAGGVDALVGQHTTVEVAPRVYRGRLIGPHFDLDKTFMLPSVFEGIQLLVRFYNEHKNSNVLVNGHADKSGEASYDVGLSRERAKAVAAYLADDVNAWYAYYSGAAYGQPWGPTEDRYLLQTVTDSDGQPFFHAGDTINALGLLRYQKARGLSQQTGTATAETRKSLIKEYMAVDGTTLPQGTSVVVHGCGHNHPADGATAIDAEDRRVEIFLFEDAVTPSVPSPDACPPPKGCTMYQAWLDATVQTVDFRHQPGVFDCFVFETKDDGTRAPLDAASLHLSGPTAADGATAGGGLGHIVNLVPGAYSVVVKLDGYDDAMADATVVEGTSPRVEIQLIKKLRLQIKLVDLDGNPRSGLDYELEIDGTKIKATTGNDGLIDQPISSTAQSGVLRYRGVQRAITFGPIDDASTVTGAQDRLVNLACGGADAQRGTLDAPTSFALMRFQARNQLAPTGQLDANTIAKLKVRHGS